MDLYLFLSPHLDDAALSCGGLIKRLTHAGKRVMVVTVFTADLPRGESPSRFARRNHSAWNAGPFPFAARAVEDGNAMKTLGAESKHLGFLDAMYRRGENGVPFYRGNTVGVPVAEADEREVAASLLVEFEDIRRQYTGFNLRVFSPLSLGGHVDHVIVRRAAESCWNPLDILYYEDYPYAGREGVTRGWLEAEGKDSRWRCIAVQLNASEIASRVEAVLKYASQVRGLFPSFIERLHEIARARIGLLSNIGLPENRAASHLRAAMSIKRYIQKAGGEKYWFIGEKGNWPDEILCG